MRDHAVASLSDEGSAKRPSVAVIVVNYNGGAFIEEFAVSLAAVEYENRRLLLVDNASTDGSRDGLSRLFPGADLALNDRNIGLAAALNQGLARCLDGEPDYVLLLNSDTTHEPDFLARLVERADGQTIVVPKILSYFNSRLIKRQ